MKLFGRGELFGLNMGFGGSMAVVDVHYRMKLRFIEKSDLSPYEFEFRGTGGGLFAGYLSEISTELQMAMEMYVRWIV